MTNGVDIGISNSEVQKKPPTDLVNSEPFCYAFTVVNMTAWQFHLLVTSSICHLTDHTPVCMQFDHEKNVEHRKERINFTRKGKRVFFVKASVDYVHLKSRNF